MRTRIVLGLVVFLTVSASYGQLKTSLLGQDVKPVCDIPDYQHILTLSGGTPAPAALLFLDLTNLDDQNKGGKAYFSNQLSLGMWGQIVIAVNNVCALAEANRDFGTVVQLFQKEKTGGPRWIATARDALWIFALFPKGKGYVVQVTETKRKTKIGSDLAELGKLARAAGFNAAATDMAGFPYVLRETRADLSVQVMSADGKNAQTVFSTKSGPEEHLSLSANLPVNSVKQLTLNSSNQVVTKDAPTEFLVGFNYNLGDVYQEYSRWDWNRLFATGMMRFSKQPLDTLGAGIGYNFGFVSAFAGPIWIRQPKSSTVASAMAAASAAMAEPSMNYKRSWRIGVAFDLSTAEAWVSKKK